MTDEQTAAAIVAQFIGPTQRPELQSAIVRALRAARDEAGRDGVVAGHMTRKAPPGHIIDDQGVARLVYGRLPMTEDGVMVGVGEYVWMRRDDLKPGMIVKLTGEHWIGQWMKLRACYSSYEAAEAAKEASK